MKLCEICKIEFPEHLIDQCIAGERAIQNCCPICANEEINELHGLPYGTPFRGEQAKANYDEAWAFLEGA